MNPQPPISSPTVPSAITWPGITQERRRGGGTGRGAPLVGAARPDRTRQCGLPAVATLKEGPLGPGFGYWFPSTRWRLSLIGFLRKMPFHFFSECSGWSIFSKFYFHCLPQMFYQSASLAGYASLPLGARLEQVARGGCPGQILSREHPSLSLLVSDLVMKM